MRLGIFAKTFSRPSLAETLDAVAAHGLRSIQLNLQSAGLAPMPASIPASLIDDIRRETEARGIETSALSGTFNMIHPDPAVVAEGLAKLDVLAAAAEPMGARLITLCTGTRDRDDMWRRHPDNDSASAWQSLLDAMEQALAIAERRQVMLGVEPEPGNVINSAAKCRRLLDEFSSPWLRVIFDPANLVSTDLEREPGDLLREAFELLGTDVAIGHAKDCEQSGKVVPAGRGIVPWDLVVEQFNQLPHGDQIPLIIHGIEEREVSGVVAFLQARFDAAR